jgi:hypothetical protein
VSAAWAVAVAVPERRRVGSVQKCDKGVPCTFTFTFTFSQPFPNPEERLEQL